MEGTAVILETHKLSLGDNALIAFLGDYIPHAGDVVKYNNLEWKIHAIGMNRIHNLNNSYRIDLTDAKYIMVCDLYPIGHSESMVAEATVLVQRPE